MNVKHSDLSVFLSVAQHLSFQRAATERGVTRSAISHSGRILESQLGVRLLNRNTRNVSLTEPGQMLASRLAPAYAQVARAVDEVNNFRASPQGTIRLTIPRAVGLVMMGPVLARLAREYPALRVDVSADGGLVDIVAEGFDAGIRFGERLQQDVIAAKIDFPLHFAVVGSPSYMQVRAGPTAPRDLAAFDCIRYRFPSGAVFLWQFGRGSEVTEVIVDGPIQLDDQELMIEAALAGAGLAFVFAERARPHLQSGRLVRYLEEWTPRFGDLYLYYPNRTFVSAGLRALIDVLRSSRPVDRR